MSEAGPVQNLQNEPQPVSVLSIQKVSRCRNVARRGQIWTYSEKDKKPDDSKSKRANVSSCLRMRWPIYLTSFLISITYAAQVMQHNPFNQFNPSRAQKTTHYRTQGAWSAFFRRA